MTEKGIKNKLAFLLSLKESYQALTGEMTNALEDISKVGSSTEVEKMTSMVSQVQQPETEGLFVSLIVNSLYDSFAKYELIEWIEQAERQDKMKGLIASATKEFTSYLLQQNRVH